MRKRIYSRYMRATSVLINVSMCLSVIFTLFFFPNVVLTCVFLIMNVKEVSPAAQ